MAARYRLANLALILCSNYNTHMANQPQNKTLPTTISVTDFINNIPDEQQRNDAKQLCDLMVKITQNPAIMWGPSIIGFDQYHYKYESGREGDMAAVGFSPRKTNLTIYLVDGSSKYPDFLDALGPHSTGKSCLYIKRLSDINLAVLEKLIKASYQYVTSRKNDMHRAE
jgi:hypothetical protein